MRRATRLADYANGTATPEDLEAARTAAQVAQHEAKRAEWEAEADANFCVTPVYAAACCHLYATTAARSAVCRDPQRPDAEAGSFEADFWEASHQAAIAAVEMSVLANFGGDQSDAKTKEARLAGKTARDAERRVQCGLLRDLFGDYFGPPGDEGAWLPCGFEVETRRQAEQWCLLPTTRQLFSADELRDWRTETILHLARSIFENEEFDRLPILADALEEAGVSDTDLLAHLRGDGPHVNGCWAIDAILGDE